MASPFKAGKVVIKDAKHFSEYADQRVHATKVLFVPETDVSVPDMPEKVPEVHGTHQVHYISRTLEAPSTCKLQFYRQSAFKDSEPVFREQLYTLHEEMAVEMTDESDETMASDEREKDSENETTEGSEIELEWSVGDWVKVEYDDVVYPGEVLDIVGNNTQVTCMCPVGKHWRWPQTKDILWYSEDKVLGKIEPLLPVTSTTRDHYTCSEL